MKYLEVLEKRNLSKEELPKGVQKKIEEIEKLNLEVSGIDLEKLSKADKEIINLSKEKISSLDEYLARKVEIFNPETYATKLQVIELAVESKKKKKQEAETESEESEVESEEQTESEAKVVSIANQAFSEKAKELKDAHEEAELRKRQQEWRHRQQLRQEMEREQEEQEEEIEEFEKVADAKPKKIKWGLLLVGVGIFAATLGVVNIIKNK